MVDVERFLDDYNIERPSRGKSRTRGWVQIRCPYADCFDDEDHMGINKVTGIFHCWRCTRKGPFALLIAKLLHIPIDRAEEIAKSYDDHIPIETEEITRATEIILPGYLHELPEPHRSYLIKRNFDPDEIRTTYQIGAFWKWGRFPYRIGIPVLYNSEMVNMTARDVSGEQPERYLSLTNEESIISIKNCVYNLDRCTNGNILIVEGPFDVWRIGGATVSLFGTAFTNSQILKILSKAVNNAFILFDNSAEAQKHARKLAGCLSPFVNHVEVVEIDAKDPGDLSPSDALEIRKELNL